MKKTLSLKFLVLSALLMVGNLVALADKAPAVGTMVGATVQGGIVVYETTGGYNSTVGGIPVKITGLDVEGLNNLGSTPGSVDLTVKTAFTEKYGTTYNHYYVEKIVDGWDGVAEEKKAFYGYAQLKSLTFETDDESVKSSKYTTEVGAYAFFGCTNLASLILTDNVSKIGKRAFQNTKITDFKIPAMCEEIGDHAFYNCQKLATVSVGVKSGATNGEMTSIGTYVFGNSTLHELDLTNATALTTFIGQPFMYETSDVNYQLKTVKLPANFTTLNHAFDNCTGLTSINLEDTKCSAVNDANSFVNCSALPALTIPATATVSGSPFALCSSLKTLTFNAYTSANAPLVTDVNMIKNPIGDGAKNLFDASGVAGATAAQKAASLAALETLTFQATKTFSATINDNAFVGCTGLKTVNFCKLQGATIGAAFTDVQSLTTLNIESITSPSATTALTTFETDAFKNTGLTALTFPVINNKADVTFEKDAFGDNKALATVEFNDITTAGTVTIDGDGTDGAFENNDALTLVTFNKVNTGTLTINQNAFAKNEALGKVNFAGVIGLSNKNTSVTINDGAFTNNKALAEVAFAGTAGSKDYTFVTIGTGALVFGGESAATSALNKVTFGNIVASSFVVGEKAFNSNQMKEVNFQKITAKVFTISENAFLGDVANDYYEKVSFGDITAFNNDDCVYLIDDNAFNGGKSKKVVEFHAIRDYDKNNTTSLTIGTSTFGGAKEAKFGEIQANTVTIGTDAFKGDKLDMVKFDGIKNVTDGPTTVTINSGAFQGSELVAKTVTFGPIDQSKYTSDNDITLDIKDNAFLNGNKTVSFGNIKAKDIKIGANAFKSDLLESVTFLDITAKLFDIATKAFEGNALANSTTFKTVQFGNITNWWDGSASAGANATYDIDDQAFNGGLKTVSFGTIKNSGTNTTTVTVADAALATTGAFRGVKSVSFEDIQASAVGLGDYAFYGDNLESVTFKTIMNPSGKTATFEIGKYTFASAATTEQTKTVSFGEINRAATSGADILNVTIDANAFQYGVKTVSFENITAQKMNIGANAFESKYLETVVFKDVISDDFVVGGNAFEGKDAYKKVSFNDIKPLTADASATIGASAFKGGEKNVKFGKLLNVSPFALAVTIGLDAFRGTKRVEIGNISADEFTVGDYAFQGDKLDYVDLKTLSSKDFEIGAYAFSGGMLKTVQIGNIKNTSATQAEIKAFAFANTNTEDVIEEEITITSFDNAKLDIKSNAFKAGQKEGSKLTLNIKNGIKTKPQAIAANAFVAPATGEAEITLGQVDADVSTVVAASAFVGSKDKDLKNTTTVTIGTFDGELAGYAYCFDDGVFTNVYSVKTEGWKSTGTVGAFAGAVEVTIDGEIPSGIQVSGNTLNTTNIESLTFTGSIGKRDDSNTDSHEIGTFNSPKIRKIEFPEAKFYGDAKIEPEKWKKNVEVHTGAVASGAFKDAYNAAKTAVPQEQILVKYYCEELNSRAGHQIFNPDAFSTTLNADKLVILYTNEWAKANIFEATPPAVNGLDYSLSSVTPGDVVETEVKDAKNGFYYGKLYLPSGSGKYKVAREPSTGVTVNVYEGRIDGEAIYMKKIDTYDNFYYIDANDMDQVFVVRSTSDAKVVANPTDAEDEVALAAAEAADEYYCYDKNDGKKNSLKYSYAGISNTELQNNEPFLSKNIYVMANPETAGFAFAKLDQFGTTRNLAKKSLYVLGKKSASARLTVIWDDEDDADAIESVTTATEQNGAIYNLNGVRVQKAQKGIFIINGKKIVK